MQKKRKTEKNILIAFLLNCFFSIFEFVGGVYTGSVAIMSDAIHDCGDALSIGFSWFLEKKSKGQPDEVYTYGYARYSVMGSVITIIFLLVGSAIVIFNSIQRIIHPKPINYNGMILIAVIGVIVNFIAAFITKDGESLNQKAVNLHMLEDVLGWIVVLLGAIIIRFTDISVIDPVLSIVVSTFILVSSLKNLKEILDVILEKIPKGITINEINAHLMEINGIENVHHVHIWTMDGQSNYATLHVVTDGEPQEIKEAIRKEMAEHHIGHVTIEIEKTDEQCLLHDCHVEEHESMGHHHHHHH